MSNTTKTIPRYNLLCEVQASIVLINTKFVSHKDSVVKTQNNLKPKYFCSLFSENHVKASSVNCECKGLYLCIGSDKL